jgi:phosphatidate cytidylyltransferase
MLKQRTLTALVLAPVAIALILFLPNTALAVVIGGVLLMALWEWTRLAGYTDTRVRGVVIGVHAVLMAGLWLGRDTPLWWGTIVVGIAWWLLAMTWLRNFSYAAAPTQENKRLKLLAGTVSVLPAWVALIQVHDGTSGPAWTLFGLILVWAADTGAFLTGRRWGRTKLAPRISPGKTWAGVYGALAFAVLIGGAGAWLLGMRELIWLGLIGLALVMVVFSIVGDLFESLLKRHANVKDSGDLFPGHGGMLDRLDSLFAALPVWAAGLALLHP